MPSPSSNGPNRDERDALRAELALYRELFLPSRRVVELPRERFAPSKLTLVRPKPDEVSAIASLLGIIVPSSAAADLIAATTDPRVNLAATFSEVRGASACVQLSTDQGWSRDNCHVEISLQSFRRDWYRRPACSLKFGLSGDRRNLDTSLTVSLSETSQSSWNLFDSLCAVLNAKNVSFRSFEATHPRGWFEGHAVDLPVGDRLKVFAVRSRRQFSIADDLMLHPEIFPVCSDVWCGDFVEVPSRLAIVSERLFKRFGLDSTEVQLPVTLTSPADICKAFFALRADIAWKLAGSAVALVCSGTKIVPVMLESSEQQTLCAAVRLHETEERIERRSAQPYDYLPQRIEVDIDNSQTLGVVFRGCEVIGLRMRKAYESLFDLTTQLFTMRSPSDYRTVRQHCAPVFRNLCRFTPRTSVAYELTYQNDALRLPTMAIFSEPSFDRSALLQLRPGAPGEASVTCEITPPPFRDHVALQHLQALAEDLYDEMLFRDWAHYTGNDQDMSCGILGDSPYNLRAQVFPALQRYVRGSRDRP